VGRAYPIAAIVEQLAGEKGVRVLPRPCSALGVLRKQQLDTIPRLLIDDRDRESLMGEASKVDRVRKDLVEMASTDEPAARGLTTSIRPYRQPDDLVVKDGLEPDNAADLEIAAKQASHETRSGVFQRDSGP
jgi:hypothetical protein